MATSGYMSTSNRYIKYTISVSQNSQSISGNTSNVTVSVRFFRTNTGYTSYGTGTVYCKINGTTYSTGVTPDQKITNGGIVLFSRTLNIPHNADGTKTLACSAWISHNVVTSSEQSYSQTLSTIPRASSFGSISGSTIGSSMTININRASSSFNHQVWYRLGSTGWVDLGTGYGASCTFTPPMSLCSRLPNTTSGIFDLCIRTLNGSSQIGDDVYKSITIYVPSSLAPSLSFTVSDATGYSETYGGYIQGVSKVKTVITASGVYGSTIRSYYATVDGKNYSGATTTSGVLTSSGTVAISAGVTDSRGREMVSGKKISVLAYSKPKISSFEVKRCDVDGTLNSGGSYLAAIFDSTITSLNGKNKSTFVLKYKKSTDTNFTTVTLTNYANNYSVKDGKYVFAAEKSASYDVQLTVTDAFDSHDRKTVGSSVKKLISLFRRGLGIAFGKVAELDNTVEFGMNTKFSGDTYGNVYGLNGLEIIPSGSDANDYINPGSYSIDYNTAAEQIKNLPEPFAGRLIVSSKNGIVVAPSGWAYIQQDYKPYRNTVPEYTRDIVRNSDGVLSYGPWLRDGQKILWTGGAYMNANQRADLSEPISQQKNGIVLIFSDYDISASTPTNTGFYNFFVPKTYVELANGCGINFNMNGMWDNAVKYLYVNDTHIQGNEWNDDTNMVIGGITYNAKKVVLRYVIGV